VLNVTSNNRLGVYFMFKLGVPVLVASFLATAVGADGQLPIEYSVAEEGAACQYWAEMSELRAPAFSEFDGKPLTKDDILTIKESSAKAYKKFCRGAGPDAFAQF
jgi:hypothetical protein